tara:strand:- start:8900 stop:9355 length:456 start_codon:yes stop_codon:yes gene_type:complete
MNTWIRAANPLAQSVTEDEQIRAARMGAVALWLTAAKDAMLLVYLLGSIPLLTAATSAAGPNGAAISLGLMAVLVVIQIVAGLFQWKRAGTMVPIVAGMLTAYALYQAGMKLAGGVGTLTMISIAIMVVALVLHIAAVRGAMALEKRRATA